MAVSNGKASSGTEVDILLNKVNLSLARSQRLIASWLPPLPTSTSDSASRKEEGKKEDIFVTEPELLGLGAPLPNPTGSSTATQTRDDKLREQLLGKRSKFGKKTATGPNTTSNIHPAAKAAKEKAHAERIKHAQERAERTHAGVADEDEEDKDQGRSALGSRKRPLTVQMDPHDSGTNKETSETPARTKKSARKGSYLDEILAENERRRETKMLKREKKKKKRKE